MKYIELTNSNNKIIVDDNKYDLLKEWKWCTDENPLNRNGYAVMTSKPNKSMHRFLMEFPKGLEVDHINHNKLDNRLENLRVVTTRENQLNRKRNVRESCGN